MTSQTTARPHHSTWITAQEAHQRVQAARSNSAAELAFLDVSEEGEYGLGHPLWSVNLPYSRLELLIQPLVPRRNTPLILVDHGHGLAELAARRLQALGYSNIQLLQGGVAAWQAAGFELFKGLYSAGKAFGELLEHHYQTPGISAASLKQLQDQQAPLVLLDPRSFAEHAARHLPQALSCPGEELLYRFHDLVPDDDIPVVVACGGRTRGILGAQTLRLAGVRNPVHYLEDGNHGWQLAGYALTQATPTRQEGPPSAAARQAGQQLSQQLARQADINAIDQTTLAQWLAETDRTTYLLDVRSPTEHAAGHLAAARSAPGGQLLQASDRWIATLGARVVLVDDDGIRANQIGCWLHALGWPVWTFNQNHADALLQQSQTDHQGQAAATAQTVGQQADKAAEINAQIQPLPLEVPQLAPQAAWLALQQSQALAISLDASSDYLQQHPPGAQWVSRARLQPLLDSLDPATQLLLFSADGHQAALAALDLNEALGQPTRAWVVSGGLDAWRAAGLPVTPAPEQALAPEQRIDLLYWVKDRRQGDRQAMRDYLDWEKQLTTQLAKDGSHFALPPANTKTSTEASTGETP